MFVADVPRTPEYGQFYGEMFAHLHIGGKVHYRTRPCRKVGLDGEVATGGRCGFRRYLYGLFRLCRYRFCFFFVGDGLLFRLLYLFLYILFFSNRFRLFFHNNRSDFSGLPFFLSRKGF